jgi:GAF domain-containing protein
VGETSHSLEEEKVEQRMGDKESNTDLEQRVAARTKELAALNAIAQTVSRSLDLDEVLNDALDKVLEVLEFESGAIYLQDLETGQLQMACHRGLSEAFRRVVAKGIISARAAESGNPIIIDDLPKEPDAAKEVVEEGYRSVASIPLLSKGQVQGVLTTASRNLRRFQQQDVDLLLSIGHQIGVAIENARLFDAEQRRAEQFRVITEVGRQITSTLDINELLVQVVRLVEQTFGYYHVAIGLIEGDEVVYRAGAGILWEDPQFQFQPGRLKVGKEGITGWVAGSGEPLLVADVSREPRYVWMPGSKTRSELAVPLKAKGKVIGVLDAQSDQLDAFDEADLVVLQSLARQATIAIENARLYEDTKNRVAQLTALQETTRAVASTLELDELLKLIIQQATTLLQADGGMLNLVDWENKEDDVVAATGSAAFTLGYGSPLEGSLSGWVALHNQPVISNQVQDDSRVDRYALSWLVEKQIQSAAVAPLTIKDQVIGTLVIIDKQGGRGEFDQSDLDLLVVFASQAAIAIQNARLFDAEQRRAEQFRVISEVGRRITSILAVDELLDQMARLIKEAFNYYHVGFGLVEGDEVVSKAEAGPFRDAYQSSRVRVGQQGIWGWVAATGEPLLVPDVSQEPRYLFLSDAAKTRSELCVPLKTKEAVIGVLDVESDQLDAFDESDLVVLQSLAHQAAIAIENARLYEQAQQVAVLEERQRLARELHDSVTQALYGVTMYAEAAARVLSSGNAGLATDHLRELRDTAQEALREMRLLVFQLRPPVLEKEGLVTALRARLEAVEERAGLETEFKVEGEERLPPEIEEGLYRIAQEALNNALRHAQAHRITVCLYKDEQTVMLEIADDGIGFDPTSAREQGGLGFPGMRERATQLGGRLAVKSSPGEGTSVRVDVDR